jgi:hypothetical protein
MMPSFGASGPVLLADEPARFDSKVIDEFVALVCQGDEVDPRGLTGRVLKAERIALLKMGGHLLGVAGLKRPTHIYRAKVFARSRAGVDPKLFPLELGWVHILPIARMQGHSLPLCRAVVDAAAGRGIFATSRVDNQGMHRALANLGFERVGKEWPSRQNQADLALFVH